MSDIQLAPYQEEDLGEMTALWNAIVEAGDSFPQEEPMTAEQASLFFASQTETVCAKLDGKVVGLYILHPNNVGRCAHTANASYCVEETCRGRGVGRLLVSHSLLTGRQKGFIGLQFNAVVCTNDTAIHLYDRLDFTRVGVIPNGFRLSDGSYLDTIVFYKAL